MITEYDEFARYFANSYVLYKTETSEVLRPFFIGRISPEDSSKTVSGWLVHKTSGAAKTEQPLSWSVKNIDFPKFLERLTVKSPESGGFNLDDFAVYASYSPRRQFIKGWQSSMFNFVQVGAANKVDLQLGNPFDARLVYSYQALVGGTDHYPIEGLLKKLENGDKISGTISRNFALGWVEGHKAPVLFHRGNIKGILASDNLFEVEEGITHLSELFLKKFGYRFRPVPISQQFEAEPDNQPLLAEEAPMEDFVPVRFNEEGAGSITEPARAVPRPSLFTMNIDEPGLTPEVIERAREAMTRYVPEPIWAPRPARAGDRVTIQSPRPGRRITPRAGN